VPRALPIAAAIYRAALQLYPPDFRREFASEMARDFLLATNEAWRAGAWRSLIGLWAHIGADLARTLIFQWLRSDWPAVALIPATVTLMGIGVTAQLLPATPVPLPVAQTDRELLALMLLIIVVLLIVAATIIFTLWFTRPLLYRRRL
jgi:hypothetical protein